MSRKERFALALLAALALLGHVVRLFATRPDGAPGAVTLLSTFDAGGGLAAHASRSAALARPLEAGERIDLNRAAVDEIARIPKVGPALAKRIVAAREEWGGFASMAEVDAVSGVGPALLAVLDSTAQLSDTPRVRLARKPGQGPAPATSRARPDPARPGLTIHARDLPVAGAPRVRPGQPAPGRRVNLNTATESQLVTLPGIGPARAKAILAYRQSHGPFASVEALDKVPGISLRLVRQLAPQVTVR